MYRKVGSATCFAPARCTWCAACIPASAEFTWTLLVPVRIASSTCFGYVRKGLFAASGRTRSAPFRSELFTPRPSPSHHLAVHDAGPVVEMSIKVIYFPVRGRAEATRLALAFTGTAFEDIRLPGPELFAAYKEKAPFGQLPLLEVDGKILAQSGSQLRYVARTCGGGVLCPADAFEAAVAGSICDQMSDVGGAIYAGGALYGSGSDEAAKAKAVEELKSVKLPKMLAGVIAYLGDKKFFGGLSPADSTSMAAGGTAPLLA